MWSFSMKILVQKYQFFNEIIYLPLIYFRCSTPGKWLTHEGNKIQGAFGEKISKAIHREGRRGINK
jgi:hypothetical protein